MGLQLAELVLSEVEGFILSEVEGLILSEVEGFILSEVEGLTQLPFALRKTCGMLC